MKKNSAFSVLVFTVGVGGAIQSASADAVDPALRARVVAGVKSTVACTPIKVSNFGLRKPKNANLARDAEKISRDAIAAIRGAIDSASARLGAPDSREDLKLTATLEARLKALQQGITWRIETYARVNGKVKKDAEYKYWSTPAGQEILDQIYGCAKLAQVVLSWVAPKKLSEGQIVGTAYNYAAQASDFIGEADMEWYERKAHFLDDNGYTLANRALVLRTLSGTKGEWVSQQLEGISRVLTDLTAHNLALPASKERAARDLALADAARLVEQIMSN